MSAAAAGLAWLLGAAVVALAAATPAEVAPAEPEGYRLEDYRAPVPATLAGAEVIDAATAAERWRDKSAVFVDVLPRPERPANLPEGTVWRPRKRENIPGSLWLPNVGFGVLSAEAEAYFQRGLETATGGDKARPLVFYCLPDCWHSWNAAKRALALGYTRVAWLPGGTDAWVAAGLPVTEAEPLP